MLFPKETMKNHELQEMNFPELVGIILGDGWIYYRPEKGHYRLGVSGNVIEDYAFFNRISEFIEYNFGKRPKIFEKTDSKGKTLNLEICQKSFVLHLINVAKIPYKNKTFAGYIPVEYCTLQKVKHVIRGLFETDGSLYFSKSGGSRSYPRIEIKTSSGGVVREVYLFLKENGFNPHIVTKKRGRTFAIYISGPKMMEKWLQEIGFSTMKNLSKYLLWKKLGHYIPRTTGAERLKMLANSQMLKQRCPSG